MICSYSTIFIAGAGRTGTTMVARILDKSDSFSLFGQETHAYPLLWAKSGRPFLPSSVRSANDFAGFIEKKYPEINVAWRHENFKPLLKQITDDIRTDQFFPESASHFLDYILSKLHSMNPGKIMGEKTPAHIYYYKEIDQYFDIPKFIITVRDPRGTALSELVKKNIPHLKLSAFNLLTFIVRWNTVYKVYDRMLKELGSGRVLLVKYEDLVTDPEPVIRQICAFAGLDFNPRMMELGVYNSSFGDKFQTNKNFNTENIDRWKTELDPGIVSAIEKNCSSLMQRFGYVKISDRRDDLTLTEKLKMYAGYVFLQWSPSWFHHINRNKMYYT